LAISALQGFLNAEAAEECLSVVAQFEEIRIRASLQRCRLGRAESGFSRRVFMPTAAAKAASVTAKLGTPEGVP
jgi:hypothetical protein